MKSAPARNPLAHEDGFILIEVLVSALILAIVAAAVLALLQATTRSAAAERNHSEAYALAQEDQARLRSMRLSTLNRFEQTRAVTLNGTTFTVESSGVFVNNSTGQPSACESGETSADYVRITSTVSWYDSRTPVLVQSIVSPSNGSLDPNHGTLVVTTKNAAGEPLAGVGLLGTGAGNFTGTTDSTGCANFADLPAGNYEVTPSGFGLVGIDGKPPHEEEVGVIAGGTNTLALEYDRGASLPVEFFYQTAAGAREPATIDSVYVHNSLASAAYESPGGARVSEFTAEPLFPFTSPVSVWAGSCESNNPGTGPGQGSVQLEAGRTAPPMELQVPALELTVNSSGTPLQGATITITDEHCSDSRGRSLVRTYTSEGSGHQSNSSTSTTAEYGLPYGTYKICAAMRYSGYYHRLRVYRVEVHSLSSPISLSLDLSGRNAEISSYWSLTCP